MNASPRTQPLVLQMCPLCSKALPLVLSEAESACGAMAGGTQLSGSGSGAAWRERLCCIPVTVAAEWLLTACGVCCCAGVYSHTVAGHVAQSAWHAAP